MTEGARYERLQSYEATVTVDLDPQPERLEHRSAQFGIGFGQRLCEVGQRVEDYDGLLNVEPFAVSLRMVKLGNCDLDLLALGFQGADSLADDDRIDAGLDRAELALDPLVDLAELPAGALPLGAVLAL